MRNSAKTTNIIRIVEIGSKSERNQKVSISLLKQEHSDSPENRQ